MNDSWARTAARADSSTSNSASIRRPVGHRVEVDPGSYVDIRGRTRLTAGVFAAVIAVHVAESPDGSIEIIRLDVD